MTKVKSFTIVALVAVMSFTILSSATLAQDQNQQGGNRGPQTDIALIVEPQSPLGDDSLSVSMVQEAAQEFLSESNRFDLIPQGRINAAEENLDFEITEDSSPRQIREFSDLVNADYVFLFTIQRVAPGTVIISATAFSENGQTLEEERSQRVDINEEGLVSRVTGNLLEELIEAI